ncbi:hypothetical protein N0V93_006501 [Gnomoniopsis smithogilvyi]|uniref:Helicase C-terminal domain-containing protein n=1 Tax=Gnomoniopsis smithogilvyi TaxID=1191159 RepID=A0A9W8YPH4_9PEZI|nr:hypothetical protein N0V93_006501 [Gnomoniopsis smithogilvyi]
MSARNTKQSGRYRWPHSPQRPGQTRDIDDFSSDKDPKGKGKAVERLQSSRNQPSQPGKFDFDDDDTDELYQYLLREIQESRQIQMYDEQYRVGLVQPNQGDQSSKATRRAQYAMTESLPRPDTTMFEEIAKSFPDPFMYMITSNLKRKTIAEVHYWATLKDLFYKDAAGRPVGFMSTAEVLRRIYYELHIRNSRDDNIESSFALYAQFGLDLTSALRPVAQTGQSISNAIKHYHKFMKSTDLPASKIVLRFHLQFSSRPNGYPSARPSKRITNYYLHLLRDPIVLHSDGTLVRLEQEPGLSHKQGVEKTTSVKKSSSTETKFSDFIPTTQGRQPETIERVLSHVPDNKVPLKQFGKNLIPETLLKLDGIFSEKDPSVLAQLGPRLGVAGIYNLDEGLLDTPSPNADEWRACCSLLPTLDPDEPSRDIRARSVPILRSTLRITPPQLYSAVEILRRPAGFLAHDMGIDGSVNKLGVVDPRVNISTGTHSPNLDKTEWINAIAQAKFSKASYDFVVVSQSSDVPAELKRGREFFKAFGNTWKLNPTLKPRDQTAPQDLQAANYDWEIGAKFGYLEPYVFVISHTDSTWYDMFSLPINGSPNKIYAAPVGLSFIDEAHNPDLWVTDSSASRTYTMARAHKAVMNCANWFVSGTPLAQTPFESILSLAKQMRLISPAKQAQVRELEDSYQQLRSANKPSLRDHHLFILELRGVFDPSIMLRFKHTTKFLDQQISNITPSQPEIVLLKTSWRSKTQMQRLAARAEARVGSGYPPAQALEVNQGAVVARDELYFVSLFPAAAELINDGTMNVDDRFIRKQIAMLEDRRQVASLPIVQEHLSRVISNGPKLKAIMNEISSMNEAEQLERPPPLKLSRGKAPQTYGKDTTRVRKMVIVTPNLSTAVFLFMYLRQPQFAAQYHPQPVLLHKDLSVATRSAIIMDFSKESGGPRILIGPFDAIGTATNLQRANYQILTSPLPRMREVAQAFGRTNRTGQPLEVHHKMLVLEDSPVDAANLCMLAQCEIKSNIYDLSQKLEIQPM